MRLLMIFALLMATVSSALAQEPKLRVAISPESGCVEKTTDGYTGSDIEIWQAIAHESGLDRRGYEFVELPFTQLLGQIEAGTVDIGLSCITATSDRLAHVDFSLPYIDGVGIGVLMKNQVESKWSRFFSPDVLRIISFWILFWFGAVAAGGVFTWIADQGNPDISDGADGIPLAIWGTFATMTTIGWGDVVYKIWRVRIFQSIMWMVSTIVINLMVADLVTSLTVNDLSKKVASVEDIHGKKVAAVIGTTGSMLARSTGAKVTETQDIQTAYALLEQGKVDAVAHDIPTLRQYAHLNPDGWAVLAGTLNHEYYSLAVHKGYPGKSDLDRAILKIREDGRFDRISTTWFGNQ